MTIETPNQLILQGLLAYLKTLTDAIPIVVAWPDKPSFKPPTDANGTAPYMEPFLLPAIPANVAVTKGTTVFRGIFQVSIYWPKREWASIEAAGMQDKVVRHFKPETRISFAAGTIDVNLPPEAGPKIDPNTASDTVLMNFPVRITYEARIALEG